MILSRILPRFSLIFIFSIKKVLADYCEFGTCDENTEYCCGENKCCKKTVDVWYYWAAVLLVVITVIVAACLYMKRIKTVYKMMILPEREWSEVELETAQTKADLKGARQCELDGFALERERNDNGDLPLY